MRRRLPIACKCGSVLHLRIAAFRFDPDRSRRLRDVGAAKTSVLAAPASVAGRCHLRHACGAVSRSGYSCDYFSKTSSLTELKSMPLSGWSGELALPNALLFT